MVLSSYSLVETTWLPPVVQWHHHVSLLVGLFHSVFFKADASSVEWIPPLKFPLEKESTQKRFIFFSDASKGIYDRPLCQV